MAFPTVINTPLIGVSLTQVWKPPVGVTPGASGDPTAAFAPGTIVDVSVGAGGNKSIGQFVRVAATGIGATGIAGCASGVTVAATAGNTWSNPTGVDLVVGDYCFLISTPTLTP